MTDFSLVHADDGLLDQLGRAAEPDRDLQPVDFEPDDRVAAMLLAWRLDVDAVPIGGLIERDEAVDVVRRAARKRSA